MSKKFFVVIISVTLGLFLLSLIGYYFILTGNDDGSSEGTSLFRNFFPFGNNTDSGQTPRVETPELPAPQNENNFTKKLRKISDNPVAGAGIVDVKAGTIIRHIEKATGHIFETELFSPNQNRISNTTIPMVYDAIWGNRALSLMARYLKEDDYTIDTYSLTVKEVPTLFATSSPSAENTISGKIFPINLGDISVYGGSVFYLEQNQDSSIGYISNFDGKNRKQIWNSPIKELLSQYVNPKTVALTTKPESGVLGFLYFVDTSSGSVRKILGEVPGLSTLVSPDASQIIYLSDGGGTLLSIYNPKAAYVRTLSQVTFPEKCVWSRKDSTVMYCAVPKESIGYGDLITWYKGFVSFTDDIWKIDTKNNTANIILNLSNESGEPIDVIKPLLSDNEQYLVFMNKRDNTLWSLDLTK